MNKKLSLLVAAPVILAAASAATAKIHHYKWNNWSIAPYVGADAEWRHMSFHRGFGDNLFRHDYPQANLYVGAKFNESIGIEAGYEATERRNRTQLLPAGATVAGTTVTSGLYHTTSRVKGPHINLVGFLPICEVYKLQLIGLVGVARLKADFSYNRVTATAQTRTFTQKKSVLRLGAGLQHMINKNWGVRGMVKWENTNKIKVTATESASLSVKAKNSVIYSMGAFFSF